MTDGPPRRTLGPAIRAQELGFGWLGSLGRYVRVSSSGEFFWLIEACTGDALPAWRGDAWPWWEHQGLDGIWAREELDRILRAPLLAADWPPAFDVVVDDAGDVMAGQGR